MRDMKSMLTYLLQKKLGLNKSNMKYEKFNEATDSEKNVNMSTDDKILELEYLNCDIVALSQELSESCESFNGLNSETGEKCDEVEIKDQTVDRTVTEEELPVKLVVTYHFSFETEENDNTCNIQKSFTENCITHIPVEVQEDETTRSDSDDKDVFEDCSFCSEDEEDLLEYSSLKNGSKNNLLDESEGPELCYSVKNVCLVDCHDNKASNSEDNTSTESDSVNTDDDKENINNLDNVIQKHGSKAMRKNYIYYSSAVKLYTGELRYEDSFPEKKFKFARKIFKKVFPSQKYVVN